MRKSSVVRFRLRNISWINYVVSVILLLVFSVVLVRGLKDALYRQAFVLTTDPVRIISWEKQRIAMQIVSIPKNVEISGVLGYGKYSLSAMQSLDLMDRKNGILLGQSLSQTTGIPIKGVIFTDEKTIQGESELSTLRRIFSWSSIVSRLIGRVGESIPFTDWMHIVFAVHSLGSDDLQVLDLSLAVSDSTRPDGEVIQVMDPLKVDYILGNALHDARIRNEYKTLTIINTTTVLGIGANLARIVNRFGIQVVSVDSESEPLTSCQIQTNKQTKNTLTYQFLKEYLHCDEQLISDDDNGVSDITLRIGTSFASLFSEYQKEE